MAFRSTFPLTQTFLLLLLLLLLLLSSGIPTLVSLIQQKFTSTLPGTASEVKDVVVDAAWALSYLTDGSDSRIARTVEVPGAVEALVSLLSTAESFQVITPCLRALGNIVSGNEHHTQRVIDAGVLGAASKLLAHEKKSIKKEAAWMVSNIAAGTQSQIGDLLSDRWGGEAILKAVADLAVSGEWEVRKESAWAVSNVLTMGTADQVCTMVDLGGVRAIASLLDCNDTTILNLALDSVAAVLKVGGERGFDYATVLDEEDGVEMLEKLQSHESDEVYGKAVDIIETYFNGDEVDDAGSENVAPVSVGGQFSFGVKEVEAVKEGFREEGGQREALGVAAPVQFSF